MPKDSGISSRHIQAFETAGYLDRQAVVLGNLAISYMDLGLYAHARRLTQAAVEMNRSMGTKLGLAYALGNLAEVEMRLGQSGTGTHPRRRNWAKWYLPWAIGG